jgi:hypothetical protein
MLTTRCPKIARRAPIKFSWEESLQSRHELCLSWGSQDTFDANCLLSPKENQKNNVHHPLLLPPSIGILLPRAKHRQLPHLLIHKCPKLINSALLIPVTCWLATILHRKGRGNQHLQRKYRSGVFLLPYQWDLTLPEGSGAFPTI